MPDFLVAHKKKRDSLALIKNVKVLPGEIGPRDALERPIINDSLTASDTIEAVAIAKAKRFSTIPKSKIQPQLKERPVRPVESPKVVQVNPKINNTTIARPEIQTPIAKEEALNSDSLQAIVKATSDSLFNLPATKLEIGTALNHARSVKSQMLNYDTQVNNSDNEFKVFQVQWHKILSNSLACIVMFLIGAPLGAIIKRGGLGVPVLASILFFIVFYILSMMGEKWSRQGIIPVPAGIWAADALLFVIGLVFLRQARLDARLFEADFYNVAWDKLKIWLRSKKLLAEEIT